MGTMDDFDALRREKLLSDQLDIYRVSLDRFRERLMEMHRDAEALRNHHRQKDRPMDAEVARQVARRLEKVIDCGGELGLFYPFTGED